MSNKFNDNEQAVNLLNNVKGSIENKIRTAYNLGYKQGVNDGYNGALGALTILLKPRLDKDINVRSKEPQTETEIAKAIVHKMIDDAVIAEDAYPDLRQEMHDAVDEYEPQTIRCPKCGRTDYIKDMKKDFGIKDSTYKYKCINCNTYIKDEPQMERRDNECMERAADSL